MTMSEAMRNLAAALDRILNGQGVETGEIERKNGFILLVFPYGDKSGAASRISNGVPPEDVMRIFNEQITQHVAAEGEAVDPAKNMAKINGIMHDLRDGKITRERLTADWSRIATSPIKDSTSCSTSMTQR